MRLLYGVGLLSIFLHMKIFPTEGSRNNAAKELTELIIQLKASGLSLFSTVTIFGCSDDNNKVEITRGLSNAFITSNMLDIYLDQFMWQKLIATTPSHQRLFILDLDCSNFELFLAEAKSKLMFLAPNKWLLISHKCPSTDCAVEKLKQLETSLLSDSEVFIWLSQLKRIISIYKVSVELDRDWQIEERARFLTNGTLLLEDTSTITSRRRFNLQGAHIKSGLVILDYDALNHLHDYEKPNIGPSSRSNYVWAKFLASMLNATISFKLSPAWGYPRANGSWDGLTGMLLRGEIEFGASPMFVTRERLKVMDFIGGMTTPTRLRFVFRRPAMFSVTNLFALPFRGSVWLGVLALALLFGFLLYPALQLEWRRRQDSMTKPRLGDETLVVIGAMAQQGFWYEAQATSTRLLVLVGLLGFLSLHAAYAANIVALLQSTSNSIKSLKDLLASPLDLGVHDTIYNRYYFKTLSILEPKIRGAIAEKSEWLGLEEGIQRLRRGHFALHAEVSLTYQIVRESFEEDEKCDFEEIDFMNVYDLHMVIAKRSSYKELLRVKAMRVRETGMQTRQTSRFYFRRPRCDAAASSRRFISVGLTECKGAFYALGYGLLTALGLFIAEVVFRRLPILRFSNQLKSLLGKRDWFQCYRKIQQRSWKSFHTEAKL